MEIELIQGGLHIDERGIISFVNDFDFTGVDRFYTIRAHQSGKPREWIGHKTEHKWFTSLFGVVLIAAVKPDNWETPSHSLPVQRFVMAAAKPAILHVPPGYATTVHFLSGQALLGVFSSGKIEDTAKDDWRFRATMWQVTT